MRLVRICISATALSLGALVVGTGGASAATPCPPGQPTGRPPGSPPGQPGQPAGRPPQYPPGQCQLLLSAASAAPRTSVTAAGSGYQPGSSVAMRVGDVPVGTASTGSDGRFTQTFTVPADSAPGQQPVRATGVGAGGAPYEQTANLEVLSLQPQQQAGGRPVILGDNLRSGAGLAAAPQGGSGGINGGAGLTPGVVTPGGITALPGAFGGGGGGTTGQTGSASGQAGLSRSGGLAPESVGGVALTGPGSGGFNPLLALGGGVLLAGLGAGIVVAARRRSSSTP